MKSKKSGSVPIMSKKGTHNIPPEGTKKESNQRQHRSFKAYCLCGRKLCYTTPQDVWDGIQPRCEKCEKF